MPKIQVKGSEITVYSLDQDDNICFTDIAGHKNTERTDDLIRNWIRNRNTLEFPGIWETLNNPRFRKQAGSSRFTLLQKHWRSQIVISNK